MVRRREDVPAATSRRMALVRRRDTGAEVALRRRLFAAGLRYRVQFPVPGRPRRTIDVAFTRAKVAVFVDGCYWHGCPLHATQSKTEPEWWAAKIAANEERDAQTTEHLEALGWHVVRVWEHETADVGAQQVLAALAAARAAGTNSDSAQ